MWIPRPAGKVTHEGPLVATSRITSQCVCVQRRVILRPQRPSGAQQAVWGVQGIESSGSLSPFPPLPSCTISNLRLSVLCLFFLETGLSANLQILSHSLYIVTWPGHHTNLWLQGPGLPSRGLVSDNLVGSTWPSVCPGPIICGQGTGRQR